MPLLSLFFFAAISVSSLFFCILEWVRVCVAPVCLFGGGCPSSVVGGTRFNSLKGF